MRDHRARQHGAAACTCAWTRCRCARRRSRPRRSSRASRRSGCCGRRPGPARRVPRDLRQVGRARRRDRRGHRHRRGCVISWRGDVIVDVPAALASPRRAGLRPADARPGGQDAAAGRPGRDAARPATPAELRETVLRMVASPNLSDKTWVTEQYDRYVLGNTVLAQPEDAGVIRDRRGDRPRRRALGSTATAATRGSTRTTGREAGAGRGVPQRRGHRCRPARRHQLPQLRLARGPERDVAVRRGGARPGRRLPGARASRSPAATSASTTRPATARSTRRPVVGVLGVLDDVATRLPMAASPSRRRPRLPARRDRRRAVRLGVGARHARAPRRCAARCRPGARARARRA